jgi:hypothetical protein
VVIGGTGGSGTRVVAQIAQIAGRFMGGELNASVDAMPLARFDWAYGRTLLGRVDGTATDESERAFAVAVSEHLAGRAAPHPWGWKSPPSYLLLPFLSARLADMRFVHVVRDGRDMALSPNQNQVKQYGDLALGPGDWSRERSLRFWAWANVRAEIHGRDLLGSRYLRVRIEDLWADPHGECERLVAFTGADARASIVAAEDIVVQPASAGRWRRAAPALTTDPTCREALAHFAYGA